MEINALHKANNVLYLTTVQSQFSNMYIAVREKEQRLFTDEEISNLPYTSIQNVHAKEWKLRQKSTTRFTYYLETKQQPQIILDIGCGNGWFSKEMALVSKKNHIIGLDVNTEELEQASRIFKYSNLQFVYGNIFEIDSFSKQFDIITLNGSVQYFPDFKELFQTLQSFLKPKGEIHIIDSPFYASHKIIEAGNRTLDYYTTLGFPEMAANYHHHEIKYVSNFDVLYKYQRSIINKLLGKKDSPFSWFRYTK
ncbi:bifunctional 2-polyprenyl-6-hydroxyphenol methylase/3-demethylubiquinol 3-O-methyltransferase UbiG [uncultured Lacinutrix sp.]|uniref:class I SAM-dependent methyltransferase n=1 Tax=uncultured Lacinutrix sp. TaxID=574032 RepID=UPI0026140619|nr:class I SAM-dependent methyltransferase [uncultured Lacinutrix sp.]